MENNLPLVSFVVPAYNVQNYIKVCIESILAQEYKNVECVCVDDGSTDGTGCILDELSIKYPSLRVIHQQNQGVSIARNRALQNVIGEFVAFVDSDDYVRPDFLTRPMAMFKRNEVLDVWSGSFSPVTDMGELLTDKISRFTVESFETNDPIADCRKKNKRYLLFCVGGKIIRRRIIADHSLTFLAGIGNGEDALFMAECFCFTQRMLVEGFCASYMRRLRPGSQTGRDWSVQVDGHLQVLKNLLAFGEQKRVASKVRPMAVHWALGRFSVLFHPGYKNLWMRKYIIALCRHPEFKSTILGTIVKYGDRKYSFAAKMLFLTPRQMLIEILFLAVCLNNLLRGGKS